jgi:hypothetical protein
MLTTKEGGRVAFSSPSKIWSSTANGRTAAHSSIPSASSNNSAPTTGCAHRHLTPCWDVAHPSRETEPVPDALPHPQQPLRMTTLKRHRLLAGPRGRRRTGTPAAAAFMPARARRPGSLRRPSRVMELEDFKTLFWPASRARFSLEVLVSIIARWRFLDQLPDSVRGINLRPS